MMFSSRRSAAQNAKNVQIKVCVPGILVISSACARISLTRLARPRCPAAGGGRPGSTAAVDFRGVLSWTRIPRSPTK